ncbi:MAG: hypothetical protein IJ062_05395 [Firmicutes bacterium]|nr:hypothetical protein [Bacillota bacterium]
MAIAEGFYPKPANPSVSHCSFLSKADKMAADSSPNEGSQETRTAVTGLSGTTKLPLWLLKKRGVVLACPFRVGGPLAVEGFADFGQKSAVPANNAPSNSNLPPAPDITFIFFIII